MMPYARGGLLLALAAGSVWLLAAPHPPSTPGLPATTVPVRPVSRLAASATPPARPAPVHQRQARTPPVPSWPATVQAAGSSHEDGGDEPARRS